MHTRHRRSMSPSRSKDMTSAPMMGAQVLSVMIFLTAGAACPCTVTRLAIWMTGSLSGSGKWPCSAKGGIRTQPGVLSRPIFSSRPYFSNVRSLPSAA